MYVKYTRRNKETKKKIEELCGYVLISPVSVQMINLETILFSLRAHIILVILLELTRGRSSIIALAPKSCIQRFTRILRYFLTNRSRPLPTLSRVFVPAFVLKSTYNISWTRRGSANAEVIVFADFFNVVQLVRINLFNLRSTSRTQLSFFPPNVYRYISLSFFLATILQISNERSLPLDVGYAAIWTVADVRLYVQWPPGNLTNISSEQL